MSSATKTIYTLGYSGWKIEQIEAELERLDAILVDVRMVPRSRAPIWNSGVLARRLGDASTGSAQGRYVWLREFGNRNYKGTVEQIEIADFPAGVAKLEKLLTEQASGRAVIILCGCPDVNVCHRKVLAEWLAQLWNAEIVHLTAPLKQSAPDQPMLF